MLLAVNELIITLQEQLRQSGRVPDQAEPVVSIKDMPEVKKIDWSELRIEQYLGQGSYGVVYRA